MDYYFIANIRIRDEKEYQLYLDEADDIFKRYKGEYLSVDNNPVILEGNWDYTRTVLIKFSSRSDFNAWYNSEAYQKILRHRLNAADCDSLLVEGLEKK
jgi:uncharacterized protein (DUF1330 family)